MERVEALAKLLGVKVEDLAASKYDNRIFSNEEAGEYIVLTEEEAYDEAKESIKNLIEDLGLESFSKDYQDRILDTCIDKNWFDALLEQSCIEYIDGIRDEESYHEEYETTLDEEMDYAGVETEEEFLDYLIENSVDSIEWYIDNFGYEEFKEVCERNDLIDWDDVIEEVIAEDGVANSITTYDGNEYEVDRYFIYRIA